MSNLARFKIRVNSGAWSPSTDLGVLIANGDTVEFQIEASSGSVRTVQFQTYDAAEPDSPQASKSAPTYDLVGATTGTKVSPSTTTAIVSSTAPGSGVHTWAVRCTVDGGVDGDGKADPDRVFERIIAVPRGDGVRKILPGEATAFSARGWADVQNDMVDAAGGGGGVSVAGDLGGVAATPLVVGWRGKALDSATFSTPANGAIARYDGTAGKWLTSAALALVAAASVTVSAIGATVGTPGLTLQNTTAADVGTPDQYSPALRLLGHTLLAGVDAELGWTLQQRSVSGTKGLLLALSVDLAGTPNDVLFVDGDDGAVMFAQDQGAPAIGQYALQSVGDAATLAITAQTPSNGAGGTLVLAASGGAGTNKAGGGVTVQLGSATGSGTAGAFRIQTAAANLLAIAYDGTLTLPAYASGYLLVDASGVVSVGAGGGGGYATVQEEGSALTARTKLNFVSANLTAADDAANTRTNVTLTDTPTWASETIWQVAATSGSPTALTVQGAAHTTLAAGTEFNDVSIDLSATAQLTAGSTIATMRSVKVAARTYSATGAQTITDAATLYVSGPPAAGTNVTITNAYSIWCGGAAPVITLGDAPGSGANAAASAGTIRLNKNATIYIRKNGDSADSVIYSYSSGANQHSFGDPNSVLLLQGHSTSATSIKAGSTYAMQISNTVVTCLVNFQHNGTSLGFFSTAATTKQTVSGSKGGNVALGSLMTALAAYGLVTDSTT